MMSAGTMYKKWYGVEFKSSTMTTEQFLLFSRNFKKCIKDSLPEGAEIVNFNRGHFYVSGFIKYNEKFMYFSISDVRNSYNDWYNKILVLTAKNEKDFTGGWNMYTSLPNFKSAIHALCGKEASVLNG